MFLARLAARSLRNRLATTLLTLVSIALSVALLLGVENVRTGMRDSFANTISRTDLIVGARGGTIQLLLYSVFGLGAPTGNISWQTYEHWRAHAAVAWTIPYSLGDSHHGFRVIGTDSSFYQRYRYRGDRGIEVAAGTVPRDLYDVAIGAEVADRLDYAVGDEIVVTHGLGSAGIMDHEERPFRVSAVLARTGTPVDRAVYIMLRAVTAMHADWGDGAPPALGEALHAEELHAEDLDDPALTSFFLGTRNRIETLRLQRELNVWEEEPLLAIMPAIALAEMWRGIGYAEDALALVAIFVVIVGLLGMLVALYTSLEARRREMAILRAIGAGPRRIVTLLVLESGLLAALGAALGTAGVYALLLGLQGAIEARFGLHLPVRAPSTTELLYIAAVVVGGFVVGVIPAWKAYRNTLADGLSIRT